LEHDLFRKPVPTFRDHALDPRRQRFAGPIDTPGGRIFRRKPVSIEPENALS